METAIAIYEFRYVQIYKISEGKVSIK